MADHQHTRDRQHPRGECVTRRGDVDVPEGQLVAAFRVVPLELGDLVDLAGVGPCVVVDLDADGLAYLEPVGRHDRRCLPAGLPVAPHHGAEVWRTEPVHVTYQAADGLPVL